METLHVYAGPSLGAIEPCTLDSGVIVWHPSIRGGDLDALSATPGSRRILIIDGIFGSQQALTISEIRRSLFAGSVIYGGVSYGALRGVECASIGMIPVGQIASWTAKGRIVNDAELSVLLGPDGKSLSIPAINVRYLGELLLKRGLKFNSVNKFVTMALEFHFSERSFAVLEQCAERIADVTEANYIGRELSVDRYEEWDVKSIDARQVLRQVMYGGEGEVVDVVPPVPKESSNLLTSDWRLE